MKNRKIRKANTKKRGECLMAVNRMQWITRFT